MNEEYKGHLQHLHTGVSMNQYKFGKFASPNTPGRHDTAGQQG